MAEARVGEPRRNKLEVLRQHGVDVYPTRFDRSHSISEALAEFGPRSTDQLETAGARVRLAGRLVAIRAHGRTAFAHLSDGASRLQIYIRKDTVKPPGFEIYGQLDLGDFIGVAGKMMRTRTGELTVRVEELTFLAKALLPLPEKWHGLVDVETRYRQRYLDLLANPESRRVFEIRSRLIREIRDFFDQRGYLEVETPMLQPIAGGAVARPFKTFHNALGMDLYLRVAPELYLKRLVVGGFEKVYEINRNFRNEGVSTRHNPEFTMLEFYEAYSDFLAMMELTEELFVRLAERVKGSREVEFAGERIDFTPPYPRHRMLDAIREALEKRGMRVAEGELRDRKRVLAFLDKLDVGRDPEAPWGKLVARLFEAAVEPELIQPTFVVDYPVDVSPLSKRKRDDPELVERFELFVGGLECANGFSELNDPEDQRVRFEAQLEERRRGDAEAHVMDEDYIRSLAHGLPPTGGEGIGIDRLAMVFTDSRSIRDVILFPHLRPEAESRST
ncbi:MAG: lysine--tRNA ligase [Acidobacteriota bacterium]